MFRLWAKIIKDNHLLKDLTVENDTEDTRTHKVFGAIEEVCLAFDLGKPIWLDSNVADFKIHAKTGNSKSIKQPADKICVRLHL